MSDLLESLRQSFADAVTRHARLVHLSIAVTLLTIPFVIVPPFLGSRRPTTFRMVLALIVFPIAVMAGQASEA